MHNDDEFIKKIKTFYKYTTYNIIKKNTRK